MTEKEKCILSIDWDTMWKEHSDHIGDSFEYKRDGSNKYITHIEKCVEKQINISITNLINNNTNNISLDTKLVVIKEIYYKQKDKIRAIQNTRYITDCSLKEAKDIVDVWEEEFTATKKEV
jgi:hypothetical protein